MKRETAHAINRRLIDNLERGVTDCTSGEMRIPADRFYCADRAHMEQQRLFRETPQPVAFAAELPCANSYLCLQVLAVPVLLTRDGDNQLHAFINSCSHRGARVANGSGQSVSTLSCSFHGWSYHLNGELRGRPAAQCFTTAGTDSSLPRLAVSERHGVIVLGLDDAVSQRAVEHALEEIGDQLDELELPHCQLIERREFTVAANWKLVNDLSLESYHFNSLHRDSVAQLLAANAVVDTFGKHSRWAFPLKTIKRLGKLEEQQWPDNVEGSCTYTLYPGVMLIVNASGAQMIRTEPGPTAASCKVSYTGICSSDDDLQVAKAAYNFGGDVFANEDLPVAEQCQQGLEASGRDYIAGANEPLLQFWHRQWQQALDPGAHGDD